MTGITTELFEGAAIAAVVGFKFSKSSFVPVNVILIAGAFSGLLLGEHSPSVTLALSFAVNEASIISAFPVMLPSINSAGANESGVKIWQAIVPIWIFIGFLALTVFFSIANISLKFAFSTFTEIVELTFKPQRAILKVEFVDVMLFFAAEKLPV